MRRIRNWCSALAAIAIATLVFASTTAWAANNVPTVGANNDGNLIVTNDIDIGKTAVLTPDCGSAMANGNLSNFVLPTTVRGRIPDNFGKVEHAIDHALVNYSNLPDNPWAMAKYSANGNMPNGSFGALKPDIEESTRASQALNMLNTLGTTRFASTLTSAPRRTVPDRLVLLL